MMTDLSFVHQNWSWKCHSKQIFLTLWPYVLLINDADTSVVGFIEVNLTLTWFTWSTVVPINPIIFGLGWCFCCTPTRWLVTTSRGAFMVQNSIISEWKNTLLAPFCGALRWRKEALFSDEYGNIVSVGNTILGEGDEGIELGLFYLQQ